MQKRKAPELTPAKQKKRFEALARKVGARQSPEQFKRTNGFAPEGQAEAEIGGFRLVPAYRSTVWAFSCGS
jgi:hypothetical protein